MFFKQQIDNFVKTSSFKYSKKNDTLTSKLF